MDWIMSNLWATGGIVVALLFVLHRVISNEKLDSMGEATGTFINGRMVSLLGKSNWNRLEKEIISWSGSYLTGLMRGLTKDNNGG